MTSTDKNPCDMKIGFYARDCPDYGSSDCPRIIPGATCQMDMQYARELLDTKRRYYERKAKR